MVSKICAYEGFTSKPRPLMNITEISTKYAEDHLHIMGNHSSKYDTNLTLRLCVYEKFGSFDCKLRPLMNIEEISTKHIRDHALMMEHPTKQVGRESDVRYSR